MKRVLFLLIFISLAAAAFANDIPVKNIFIEGTALNNQQRVFFLTSFKEEGIASGYNIVDRKSNAAYTFSFTVEPNIIFYQDGTSSAAPPGEEQYNLHIFLYRNVDGSEVVRFDYLFTELEDVRQLDQYLFLRAVVHIPHEELAVEYIFIPIPPDGWRNKLFYLRLSVDLPFVFYSMTTDMEKLNIEGLEDKIYWSSPVNFMSNGLPERVTIGLEYQFLNFMSIEPNVMISWEKPGDEYFFNVKVGAQLKFPIKKIAGMMIEPYGAFLYTVREPEFFASFPQFAAGGGIQLAAKAGNNGGAFIDFSYMQHIGDAVMYKSFDGLFDPPIELDYRRFVVGIGLGYKYGLRDRH